MNRYDEKKYIVVMCIEYKMIFWNINERENYFNVIFS